jgi:hypothetical protein
MKAINDTYVKNLDTTDCNAYFNFTDTNYKSCICQDNESLQLQNYPAIQTWVEAILPQDKNSPEVT